MKTLIKDLSRLCSRHVFRIREHALRGFSLAEVLIAIVIITILTIGSLAVYSSQLGKARDTERGNDISRIKLNLDEIVARYGAPPGADNKSRRLTDDCKSNTADLWGCFTALKLSSIEDLKEMLLDPSADIKIPGTVDSFIYKYGANDNSYSICATLEDQQSSLINSNKDGGTSLSTTSDNMYCLRYTAPGGTEVIVVEPITDPEGGEAS
ncbi:MAG: prepilin-type N-terminal cleavage/methylation domain-containing protein [Candidatus Gracilibacteria bacterium]|nr:prepilin-type N-terminal cleavage/methylation domain-containing protein [Candidatus Gracilibacteria bacterium]